jgi:uncharacterized membrane protein YhiD involved in acid resistance
MALPDLRDVLVSEEIGLARFEIILVRLVVAAVLGAVLGYRVWRRFLPHALPPTRETAQAQTLIAVAGALMVVVIGHSTARAFGLVGLGAFIRFRSGIKDPRDAAVMFVMIGIGMACGLGALPMAVIATMFAGGVLALFDVGRRARLRVVRVAIAVADPRHAFEHIRAAFPGARAVELPNTNPEPGRIVVDIVLGEGTDAAGILRMLEERKVPGVKSVSLDEGKSGGGT